VTGFEYSAAVVLGTQRGVDTPKPFVFDLDQLVISDGALPCNFGAGELTRSDFAYIDVLVRVHPKPTHFGLFPNLVLSWDAKHYQPPRRFPSLRAARLQEGVAV
jgi:hypothetical protein